MSLPLNETSAHGSTTTPATPRLLEDVVTFVTHFNADMEPSDGNGARYVAGYDAATRELAAAIQLKFEQRIRELDEQVIRLIDENTDAEDERQEWESRFYTAELNLEQLRASMDREARR